jgi:PilZ domain-containing protein
MEKKFYPERRRYQRVHVLDEVSVEYQEFTEAEPVKGTLDAFTKNLSLEGLCLVSDRKFCPGETLKMVLKPKVSDSPIKIYGNVVAVKTVLSKKIYETSVSVYSPEKEETARFKDYVNSKFSVCEDAGT